MPEIIVLAAIDSNYALGGDNRLLWSYPEDLKRFKTMTTDQTILMGRNTWESLPRKPLPNRKNMVLTSRPDAFKGLSGVEAFTTFKSAIDHCFTSKLFIIGGAQIYAQAAGLATKVELTRVPVAAELGEVDTWFPIEAYLLEGWKIKGPPKNPGGVIYETYYGRSTCST